MTQRTIGVFVDARMARCTGIGRYIECNLRALCAEGFHFVAGVPDEADAHVVQDACGRVETTEYRAKIYGPKERILRLQPSVRRRIDVYWYPQYNVPFFLPKASVVTVHDLIQFDFNLQNESWSKRLIGRVRVLVAKLVLTRAVKQAGQVVCVSETTQRDLEEFVPALKGKTIVIRNGVSMDWAHCVESDVAEVNRLSGGGPFLLAVGVKKTHKNHKLLLRVLDELVAQGLPHKLVIIGKREPGWIQTVEKWVASGGDEDRLVDLDYVSDSKLAAFYRRAEILLMPSLSEGFGFPPLEAMVAGVPVICSDRGALPSTVGDAAIVLDPYDFHAWVKAVRFLLDNPSERIRLTAAGSRRVKELSWQAAASKLGEVLRRIAHQNV